MNLLNKLTIKSLKLNKKRTIMTIIGIILSVALLTAVANMFFSARESMILYQKHEQGNYHYGFDSVLKDDLQKLEQNRKIETIYVANALGYARLDGVENEYKPYAYIKEFDQDALLNMCINLTEGRYPVNAEEVVIPTHLKNNGGLEYKIGDTITLEVGERVSDGAVLNQYNPFNPEIPEEIINTQTKTYTVVGIMERFPYRLENFEAPGYTFISYLEDEDSIKTADIYVRYAEDVLKEHYRVTANILGVDEDAFEAINGGLFTGVEEYDELQAKIANPKYDFKCNDYLLSLERGVFGNSTLNALAMAAMIVVFIIIGTSVFCIKNSFDISITEKIRQYGMLASIGATKKQIKRNVYYEAMILGGVGIPLGILSGTFAAYVLILISNQLLKGTVGFDLVFSFSWLAVAFAIALGVVTILLSAQRSARNASKIAPIQAIRNNEEVKIRRKEIKSPKWVKKIFGIGGEVSYKNLQRSKRKYRTTVVSIVVCVSVFIALSSFVNMAFDVIRVEFKDTNYSLEILYMGEAKIYDALDEIRELDGVKQVTGMARTGLSFEITPECYTDQYLDFFPTSDEEQWIEGINVYILDAASFQKYAKELHLNPEETKEKGILLNTIYIEEEKKQIEVEMFALEKGDMIDGYTSFYSEEKEETVQVDVKIEIAKTTDKVPMGISQYNNLVGLILEENYYEKMLEKSNMKFVYIDSENSGKTQDDLESIFNNLEEETEYFHINNIEENANQMRSFYTLISIFLYGFITVIALIGVTNIFNTITTNMNLRRREFAMLKSVGMTTKEFNRMIQLESFFYGTKALLIGIPIGCMLSYVIYDVLMEGAVILAYRIPITAILISAAAVFLLITVIMKYSIGKINQQNIIETIRNENI